MEAVNPYLNFPGNTEEAFNFYRSVFGGEFAAVLRFRDFGDNSMGIAEADLDKIAHIALPLGPNSMLMATDHVDSFPQKYAPGNNFYIALTPESAEEAERLFGALSEGGEIEMELQQTAWAEKHGSCADRFGARWMVDYAGSVQVPG
ncbi:VOC family protein [soil metagenome]